MTMPRDLRTRKGINNTTKNDGIGRFTVQIQYDKFRWTNNKDRRNYTENDLIKNDCFLLDIQRINNRILVFVVPMEFVAIQPIEWLCTCRDRGILIVGLVNDVKSMELANQLLENIVSMRNWVFFEEIFPTENWVQGYHEQYNEMLQWNSPLMDDDFEIRYGPWVYLNRYIYHMGKAE